MGEKSVQKKRYIVEKARDVFMEKGFKKVTMKDIVEACDISRGGLYLYFENTSQIFMEVLRMESEEADDVFSDSRYSSSVFKGAEKGASPQKKYADTGNL